MSEEPKRDLGFKFFAILGEDYYSKAIASMKKCPTCGSMCMGSRLVCWNCEHDFTSDEPQGGAER